jgi:hypothetical protein
MNKEFVPYEEALALKELGFDEPCFTWYWDDIGLYKGLEYGNHNKREHVVSAPTFSQSFKFFREKYNLEYQIIKSANGNYSAVIHLNTQEYLDKISTLHHACVDEVVDCYSYEEAELACLRKLIELVKK